MPGRSPRKPRPALDAESLQSLALRYVERFATSRAKLGSYLHRKLNERGWAGDVQPNVDALVERLSNLGYVDDRSFALTKARSLGQRGYGGRRVQQALRQAGIQEDDQGEAVQHAIADRWESALRFARRKRLGPFGGADQDRSSRERALAAMVRAGHGFEISRRIIDLNPGDDVDELSASEDW